ncbi:MAG: TlpA family protein disulfide reductase [Bacteroidetes bacterium]|jgi:thiol-disulfide isomerase/thioredoxin|nr:TlpA family protein disulfide reductase [Bacteroidota bacterium]MBS1981735.1 TlpA family protein disulfide reductase [Bacteroidota bacterium]
MTRLKVFIRSYRWLLIIPLLYVTGALTEISSFTQRAVIQAGFVNASPTSTERQEAFDYDFTIKDLAGNKIDFSTYKGKTIFLNLWATWCPPCRSEMPSIQKVFDTIDKTKIEFVMLSLDKDGQLDKVKKYVAKNEFTFPVFMPSGYLSEQLNVPSIPTTFVISPQGNIVYKEIGMRNYNTPKFMKFLTELTTKQ